VTIAAQHAAGAVHPWAAIPLGPRLGNAALSAIAYLGKCAWPLALAVPYPYPVSLSPAAVAGAAVAILAITLWAARRADRRPYLIVGWAWYLITLVPVSGIVQVGDQARADRYTYLPLLGIFVALAWAVADALHGRPRLRVWAAAGAAASLAALAILAARQVAVWADTVTLFQNAVRATRGNYVAHTYLGIALAERGRTAEAIHHLEAVEAMDVAFPDAPHALGRILERSGDVDGAAARYRRALGMQADHAASLVDLGRLLAASGALEQALSHYERALRLRPDDARLLANLGIVLTRLGRPAEGVAPLERAVALEPGDLESRTALAAAYLDAGRVQEAERTLRTVLERDPNHVAARANMGVAAQRAGRFEEAASHFEQALRSEPGDSRMLEALGDTRALLGDREGARRAYEAALRTGAAGPEIHQKLAFLNESVRSGSPLPSVAK
jgi:Flp pilus assembly protein TadD